MLELARLSDMEVRVAAVTVTTVVPKMFAEAAVAVMVAVPSPIPMTRPVLLTVATESLDELQVA